MDDLMAKLQEILGSKEGICSGSVGSQQWAIDYYKQESSYRFVSISLLVDTVDRWQTEGTGRNRITGNSSRKERSGRFTRFP